MNERKIITGALLAAARGALICCGICLLELRSGGAGKIFPLSVIVYAVAVFLYNRLVLRKDRTVGALAGFNFSVFAAYFIAVSFLEPWRSFGQAVTALALVAMLTVQEVKENLGPIGLHSVILAVDISFFSLAVSMAVLFSVQYSAQWAVCAMTGVICAFAALLSYRLDCLSRTGRIGVLSVGAAAAFMITLAASQRAAFAIGKAIVAVWNVLVSAAAFFADRFERFMLWLASFMPEIDGEIDIDARETLKLPAEEPMPDGWDMTWLLYAIAVCVAAAALVFLIKKKKARVSAENRLSAAKVTSEKVRLRFAVGMLFSKLRAAICLARALRLKRKTPAGVYLHISKCAVKPRKSETAQEYLLRLAAHDCVMQSEKAALSELAAAVNRQLYSRAEAERFSGAGELRFFGIKLVLRLAARTLKRHKIQNTAA